MTAFQIDPGQLFIGGTWRESAAGARTVVIDPSRGRAIITVAEAGPADVDDAVRAAREAYESGPWARYTGRERGRVLLWAAELIRQEADRSAERKPQRRQAADDDRAESRTSNPHDDGGESEGNQCGPAPLRLAYVV